MIYSRLATRSLQKGYSGRSKIVVEAIEGFSDDRLDDDTYKRTVVAPVRAAGSLAALKAAAFSN
jgi:hypothetical protein